MAAGKTTIDHQEIKRWVESHGGHPATVKRTRSKNDAGLIRVDFPGFSGEGSLEPISWDEWFAKFDEQELAFIYQEGKNTNFNKLVRRDPEKARPSDRRRRSSRTATATSRARSSTTGTARRRSLNAGGSISRTRSSRSGTTSTSAANRGAKRAKGSSTRAPARRGGRRPDIHALTKAELYELARSAGLEQRSSMNKSELIRALERQQR
jgi:hypothetical protein